MAPESAAVSRAVGSGHRAAKKDDAELNATGRAANALREMIMRRRILPGEQLRQEELSERLNLSRSPLREALRTLETEGFVRYERNQGYFVAHFNADQLEQLYLMRRVLETEMLKTVREPTAEDIAILRGHNAVVEAGAAAGSIGRILVANQQFHMAMLGMSPLGLVHREVERLWKLSEPYRASYLSLPETRVRIVHEHDMMIDALAAHDLPLLIQTADQHRTASERSVLGMLAGPIEDF